jgi:hypothetical protein
MITTWSIVMYLCEFCVSRQHTKKTVYCRILFASTMQVYTPSMARHTSHCSLKPLGKSHQSGRPSNHLARASNYLNASDDVCFTIAVQGLVSYTSIYNQNVL